MQYPMQYLLKYTARKSRVQAARGPVEANVPICMPLYNLQYTGYDTHCKLYAVHSTVQHRGDISLKITLKIAGALRKAGWRSGTGLCNLQQGIIL